jgi:hypothetical protein
MLGTAYQVRLHNMFYKTEFVYHHYCREYWTSIFKLQRVDRLHKPPTLLFSGCLQEPDALGRLAFVGMRRPAAFGREGQWRSCWMVWVGTSVTWKWHCRGRKLHHLQNKTPKAVPFYHETLHLSLRPACFDDLFTACSITTFQLHCRTIAAITSTMPSGSTAPSCNGLSPRSHD